VVVWSAFGASAASGSGAENARRRSAPLVNERAMGERPASGSFTGTVGGAGQRGGQEHASSFDPATRGPTAPEGLAAANSGVTTAKSFATAAPDAIEANVSAAATAHATVPPSPAPATPNAAARSDYGHATTRPTVGDERRSHPADAFWLVVLYGVPGFGYIITATFLPVIARHALPGSPWPDLFWPMFGAALIVGALLAARLPLHLDNRVLLAGSYVLQACGIALGIVWPTAGGFSLGSILIGVPFTAITLFAMREARRLRGDDAAGLMGYATAAYGLGQIIGPLVAAPIAAHTGSFSPALWLAAGVLLLGAGGLVAVARMPRGRGRMPECGCG